MSTRLANFKYQNLAYLGRIYHVLEILDLVNPRSHQVATPGLVINRRRNVPGVRAKMATQVMMFFGVPQSTKIVYYELVRSRVADELTIISSQTLYEQITMGLIRIRLKPPALNVILTLEVTGVLLTPVSYMKTTFRRVGTSLEVFKTNGHQMDLLLENVVLRLRLRLAHFSQISGYKPYIYPAYHSCNGA